MQKPDEDARTQVPRLGHVGVVEPPGQDKPVAGLVQARERVVGQRLVGQGRARVRAALPG